MNYRYKFQFTRLGIFLSMLPIIIITIYSCVVTFVNYKTLVPMIGGIIIIILYCLFCIFFIKTSYCTINNSAILVFFCKIFEIRCINFSDIINVDIEKSIRKQLHFGANEIVIKTDKKEIRLGLMECDKFIRELNNAIDLFNNK